MSVGAETLTPAGVAAGLESTCVNRVHDAGCIVRAYAKQAKHTPKRCPPGWRVIIPPNSGGIEACAVGWLWDGRRFVYEAHADGLGPRRRQEARDGAWELYRETWQAAHDALVQAGVLAPNPAKLEPGRTT